MACLLATTRLKFWIAFEELADTAFGSNEFVLKFVFKHHVLGVHRPEIEDGRSVAQLYKRGQQVQLFGLKFPVHLSGIISSVMMARSENALVLSTKALVKHYDAGRRRWEFFKTAKHRFVNPTSTLIFMVRKSHQIGVRQLIQLLNCCSTDGIITIVGRKSTLTTLSQTPWLLTSMACARWVLAADERVRVPI